MVQITYFSTSMPVIDRDTDAYPDIIANSIENEIHSLDPDAEVNCAIHIKKDIAMIAGEIEADTAINASKVVRKTINRLFSKQSLYHQN